MKLSYIAGNENTEKSPYISRNGTFYISKNGSPDISGNGTFLYFRRNFQGPKNRNFLYLSKKSYE